MSSELDGDDHGVVYTGDESTYLVTMLRRDSKRGTALVKIERTLRGVGSLPAGARVTVPLRRIGPHEKPVQRTGRSPKETP